MKTQFRRFSGFMVLATVLGIATVLTANTAQAILEVNIGYEGIASSSGGGNWTVPNATYSGAYGLQGDVRLNFPTSDWNFGARYTNMSLNASSNGNTLAMSNSSVSGLIGYRLINTFLLLGPVVTYGIANSGSLQNSLATTGSSSSTPSSITQYTAGLEFGIKLPILLSVEAGYGSLAMSGFSNNQQLNGNPTNVSISGLYARASVGFSF